MDIQTQILDYTVSLNYDRRLYHHDIRGSKAHARMLCKQGIISDDDAIQLELFSNRFVSIDLEGKSSIADFMIIASGTSSRHIQSLSEQVFEKFKSNGIHNCKIEGKDSNDWKLVDGIDLIVHIFNPEKRKFYELEKIWSELMPKEKVII